MSISKCNFFTFCALISSHAYSFTLPDEGYAVFQVGGFIGSQGKQQLIGIESSLGNEYTVEEKHRGNVLLGLGYYLEGFENDFVEFDYGVNVLYLFESKVTGDIVQEQIFTNLAYSYEISHVPIYAAIKLNFEPPGKEHVFTIDGGIGANIMITNHYEEHSLDGGFTNPNHSFSNKTTGHFSAMVGAGIKIHDVFYDADLELAYRFLYLGKGHLEKNLSTELDELSTGNVYANALILSLSM